MHPSLVGIGLFVGTMVGLTGMGGGALMTPLLILLGGMAPTQAVGTDLVYATMTKLVGTWQHRRQGTVDGRLVLQMAAGSLPSALLAGLLARWYSWSDSMVRHGLGWVLVLVAVAMVVRLVMGARKGKEENDSASRSARWWVTIPVGAAVGAGVGLTSVGSGTFVAIFLVLTTALPAKRVVGTDMAHGAMLVAVAAMPHVIFQRVEWGQVALLLLGSLPGVLLGSRMSIHLPQAVLRGLLAAVLLGTGARML